MVIYATKSSGPAEAILARAKDRFCIAFNATETARLTFVSLRSERLLTASLYPRFTLIGQSLGSMVVAVEALVKWCPDVYVDSMGYAFTLPIARVLCGCYTACYVHYPTISSDMLNRVYEMRPAYNNDELIAGSVVVSRAKVAYYMAFAAAYAFVGRAAQLVMVNSSWTANHIKSLWPHPDRVHIVFPPCDVRTLPARGLKDLKGFKRPDSDELTTRFSAAEHAEERDVVERVGGKSGRDRGVVVDEDGVKRRIQMVSIGQFRPEKNHALQLQIMAELKRRGRLAEDEQQGSTTPERRLEKCVLIGSCRDAEDEGRVQALRTLREKLGLEAEQVEFKVNAPYAELREALETCLIGVHTMWNEHFGIGIVEMMDCGLITIAHASGGPLMDIIKPGVDGFVASTAEEYADAVEKVLDASDGELQRMRDMALQSVQRFADAKFVDVVKRLLAEHVFVAKDKTLEQLGQASQDIVKDEKQSGTGDLGKKER